MPPVARGAAGCVCTYSVLSLPAWSHCAGADVITPNLNDSVESLTAKEESLKRHYQPPPVQHLLDNPRPLVRARVRACRTYVRTCSGSCKRRMCRVRVSSS